MTKLLTAFVLAAFALGAQAASHAGAAPMKADAAASAASGAKKAEKKPAEKPAAPAKKEEAKK